MACKGAFKEKNQKIQLPADEFLPETIKAEDGALVSKLIFGVDSKVQSNNVLQNNLTMFQWAERNKIYPGFWGRNLTGENRLTKEEIDFLHRKACKIAPLYEENEPKETEEQGFAHAEKIAHIAQELNIPFGTAIYLEIGEDSVGRDYMRGYAAGLLWQGYTPGFRSNTDAKYQFDVQFSRGLQTDREIFEKCLVWAVAPSLEEYERVTTTHLIHPDNWIPFAPSGITRSDIAVWQYGKECHPINDNEDHVTVFNINLVRNNKVIIKKMF